MFADTWTAIQTGSKVSRTQMMVSYSQALPKAPGHEPE